MTDMIDQISTYHGDEARAAVEWAKDCKPDGKANSTRFWGLPKDLRKPFADADPETGLGSCCCRYCSPESSKSRPVGCWDTLAIGVGNDRVVHAWLCHGPEFRGVKPKRSV